MNIELLRQVQEKIRQTGKVYMPAWFIDDLDPSENNCGTIGCIAGWACMIEDGTDVAVRTFKDAANAIGSGMAYEYGQRALEIDRSQALRLFSMANWPEKFRDEYNALEVAQLSRFERNCAKAKVTSDRIDHFIATNGEE